LADASSNSINIDLPLASSSTDRVITIERIDGTDVNTVTIDANTDTIDGEGSLLLNGQYDSLTCVSDGSEWFTFTRKSNFGSVTATINSNTTVSNSTEVSITGASITLPIGRWTLKYGGTVSMENTHASTQAISTRLRIKDGSSNEVTDTSAFTQFNVPNGESWYVPISWEQTITVTTEQTYTLNLNSTASNSFSTTFRGADLGVFVGTDNAAYFRAEKVAL